jgi:hypothetical protein
VTDSLANTSTYAGDPAATAGGKGGKDPAGGVDYSQLIRLAGKMTGKGSLQNGPLGGADYAEIGRLPGQLPEAMGPMDYQREPGEEYADNQPAVLLGGKKKPPVAAQNKTAAGNGTISPLGGKMGELGAKNLSAGGGGGQMNSSTNANKAGTNGTAEPMSVSNNATGAAPGGKNATGAADGGAGGKAGPAADLGPEGMGPLGGLANGANGMGPGMGAEGVDGAAPGGKVVNVGNGKNGAGATAGGKGSLPDLPNGKK